MRILHIADLHLGAKNSKLPKEKQDVLRDEMIEKCHHLFANLASRFDAVVVCGDLFHNKSVSVKVVDNFFQGVEIFGKPVLYVNGNHDEKFIMPSTPKNFIVLDKDFPCYEMEDCCFWCGENIGKLNQNKANVLLLHGNIENTQDNDYIDINKYLSYNFDYIALGHLHQVKKYKKGQHVFAYSGSLFSNGFDECGEKGYIDVELVDKKLHKCEFKSLVQRKYLICEHDITNETSNAQIEAGIRNDIARVGGEKGDIYRIVLKGYYEEFSNKSIAILTESLADYFYLEIQDKSKLKIDLDKLKNERLSLKNEFISLVENSCLSDEIKAKVVSLGIEALKGEDLSL